eukprot:5435208-Pyramimonas_sp.AAC.1
MHAQRILEEVLVRPLSAPMPKNKRMSDGGVKQGTRTAASGETDEANPSIETPPVGAATNAKKQRKEPTD